MTDSMTFDLQIMSNICLYFLRTTITDRKIKVKVNMKFTDHSNWYLHNFEILSSKTCNDI